MPWSVPPLRLGRGWVRGPDPASLRARWDAVIRAKTPEARRDLFAPTRLRTPQTSVAALPGQRTATTLPLALSCVRAGDTPPAAESVRCPEPVRVLHGPFDEHWLIPDHRLIDVARPELWRVLDTTHQLFTVEQGYVPGSSGPALLATALLPDGHSPAGRPGRIRPLYRRPGGREPNLTPGLTAFLGERYGREVAPEDVLAWALATARPSPRGAVVPLPRDPEVWQHGLERGHRLRALLLRGARGGERPRLPGGRRPYVRAAVPARPGSIAYDRAESSLIIGGTGRISPVPEAAWTFETGGVRVLERWFEVRTGEAAGPLEALRPSAWPKEWSSELLELVTVLGLYAELAHGAPEFSDVLTREELTGAGVLPVPASVRRPASVLDHHEEGPGGQFALL
ncbi:DNA methyltransferase [Streptomyces sp. NBC_00237]|uniref:type ISP restriction/modification enzyme n=1 Tax=Streptomyces sp. NBC_00237 TaxID=2975687 RepID=UPI00225B6123|nr:type ISP restriction/modification enzyme [Streptomyces sp. NBC_00237]MCX5202208.1 DNA methyltransferase [Streptomyces sp. NBC_00237]